MRLPGILLLLLVGAACRGTPEEPAVPAAPARAALPDGFVVKVPPRVEDSFLPPEAAWRWIVSRLTTLRADARGRRQDLLVSFEADAFHVTERSGRRRTWRLPDGLVLEDVPAHVVLGGDLTVAVFGPDGRRRAGPGEIPVVRARIGGEGAPVQEFRLVVKGGTAFRSISTAG